MNQPSPITNKTIGQSDFTVTPKGHFWNEKEKKGQNRQKR